MGFFLLSTLPSFPFLYVVDVELTHVALTFYMFKMGGKKKLNTCLNGISHN